MAGFGLILGHLLLAGLLGTRGLALIALIGHLLLLALLGLIEAFLGGLLALLSLLLLLAALLRLVALLGMQGGIELVKRLSEHGGLNLG